MFPSWIRSRNCKSAVGVFFGDRHHQPKVGFNQFFLCNIRFQFSRSDRGQRPLQFESCANASLFDLSQFRIDLLDSFLDSLGIFKSPGCFEAFVELVQFALQRDDFVDGLLDDTDESVMLQIVDLQSAHLPGNRDAIARQHGEVLFIEAGSFAAAAELDADLMGGRVRVCGCFR